MCAWLLLTAYNKMWEEKNDLKMELLIRKEADLKASGDSQPVYIERIEKACTGQSPKGMAKWPRDQGNGFIAITFDVTA